MQNGYNKFALAKAFMRDGKHLTDPERVLLFALWNHSDENGCDSYPGHELLAEECGWSTRKVERTIKILKAKGWVHEDRRASSRGRNGGGWRAVYSLRIPDPPELPDTVVGSFDGNQPTNNAESPDISGESPDKLSESPDKSDGITRHSYVAPTEPLSDPEDADPLGTDPRGTDPRATHLADERDSSAREATTDDDKHEKSATSRNGVAEFKDGTEEDVEQSPGMSPSPSTHVYNSDEPEPDYDERPDPAEYEWIYNILDGQEVSDEVPAGNCWECGVCRARVEENTPPEYTFEGRWVCTNHAPNPLLIPWEQRATA